MMEKNITIQPLTPPYIEEIFPLVSAMHMEMGDMTLEKEDYPSFLSFYVNFLAQGGIGLMAMDGADPIGFMSFNILPRPYKEKPYGFCLHCYVKPEYRKSTIARTLADTATRMVQKVGITTMEFLITPQKTNIAKWKRRGWKVRYAVMTREV